MKYWLFVLKKIPFPVHRDGASIINYRLLKNLPRDIKVDIVCREDRDPEKEEMLKKEISQINNVYFSKDIENSFTKLINLIFVFLFGIVLIKNKTLCRTINALKKARNYGIIYVCPISMITELYRMKNIPPLFLNAIDSLANLNESFYRGEKSLRNKIKCIFYKQYEKKILANAGCINFVSQEDQRYVQRITGHKNIQNISLGIDTKMFFRRSNAAKEKSSILFSGNFSYKPNMDTALYIIKTIYPAVRTINPGIKIFIVGKNSSKLKTSEKNIIITGYVDDIAEWYNRAEIFFGPLLYGAGIKNKILEAMACGIPIITNSTGANGITGLADKEHFILAETTEEQLNAIRLLLSDNSLRKKISQNAERFIKNYLSWDDITERYYNALNALASEHVKK